MADVSVTAASVQPGTTKAIAVAGASITAGESIYIDANGKAQLAKADTTTHAGVGGGGVGIAMNGAATGQYVSYQQSGDYTVGGTVAVGTTYVVSPNSAGGIAPYSDLSTGNIITVLGIADTTSTINLNINISGIAHA